MKIGNQKQKLYRLGLIFLTMSIFSTGCSMVDAHNDNSAKLIVNGDEVQVPYVMKINSQEVSLDEYRYFFLTLKEEKGGEEYWLNDSDGGLEKKLKEETLAAICENYAIKQLACENDLELSDKEVTQINNDLENVISSFGSTKNYTEALKESYLTDTIYRKIWETTFCFEKLYSYYFSEDGPYYISDTEVDDEDKQLQYLIKLQALTRKTADYLDVELGPEYELIGIDTLT